MLPSEYIRMGWCQDTEARDAHGVPCEPTDSNARSWCSTAAASLWPDEAEALHILVEMAFRVMDDDYILDKVVSEAIVEQWNDAPERTMAEIIAVMQETEQEAGVRAATDANTPLLVGG